jgi:hypothetical protein
MTTIEKIYAPWTPEEVAALNEYQDKGVFHPFTCGHGALGQHVSGVFLVATEAGWRCPFQDCEYTQDWAWSMMAEAAHHVP